MGENLVIIHGGECEWDQSKNSWHPLFSFLSSVCVFLQIRCNVCYPYVNFIVFMSISTVSQLPWKQKVNTCTWGCYMYLGAPRLSLLVRERATNRIWLVFRNQLDSGVSSMYLSLFGTKWVNEFQLVLRNAQIFIHSQKVTDYLALLTTPM